MELTEKQKEGLRLAVSRYKNGERYTVIAGYAGTGKTTLVRSIIEELGVAEKDVCYTAYTGKATEVLKRKGNPNCMTLHKLLYDSFPLPTGGFRRVPKTRVDYKVVVADEISMAPLTLISKLYSYKVYILFLGDPFQLPPVEKKADNHFSNDTDVRGKK